jgi:hypothetical protein
LLWFVLRSTNAAELGAALAGANYLWLVPALAVYFVGVWLRALRWQYLLRPIQRLPAALLFRTIIIGYTANDVLPFRLGEVVRAFVLGRKTGISSAATLTTIVVERLMDGLTMVAFMVTASLLLPLDAVLQDGVRISAVVFVAALAVLYAVVLSRRLADAAIGLVLRPLPAAAAERLGKVARALLDGLAVLRSGRDLAGVALFSVLGWLPEAAMYWLIAQGFAIQQPFTTFMLTTAAGNLGAMIPSTPGYVGVFDAPAKYVLVLAGVPDAAATSFILVLHAALLLPVIALGLFFLWREGLSMGTLAGKSEVS